VKQTLRDLYLMGDVTIVRSARQATYLSILFDRFRPATAVAPGIDPGVPQPSSLAGGCAIVIWAAGLDAADVGIHLFALESFKADIVVIAASGSTPYPNARIASLHDAEHELARAALLIDASLSDPASAIALAEWGVPLVAASTSGANEFLSLVRLYDPWNWRSILAAASAARAEEPPTRTQHTVQIPVDHGRSSPAVQTNSSEPLVTIIVPTYNRPDVLPIALDSLEAQEYRALEILVVNDGGAAVDHVVARYPRARLIVNECNSGAFVSLNNGIASARGRYIGLLCDDDIYYPDQVPRLVAALERSRSKVAHGNALTKFIQTQHDGTLVATGHHVLFAGHLDTTEVLWGGAQTNTSLLLHRDVFEEIGTFDAELAQADYEFLIRLSRHYDFVHVDHVTCEFRYRTDRSTMSHNMGAAQILDGLNKIFERYPSNGDAFIDQSRKETLAFFVAHHGGQYWEPAIRLEV
jgi:glycosyltransferase involved in cell wall biosynthesis